MASVFPLFGVTFFRRLGLGPGSSLLAAISIGLMVIYYVRAIITQQAVISLIIYYSAFNPICHKLDPATQTNAFMHRYATSTAVITERIHPNQASNGLNGVGYTTMIQLRYTSKCKPNVYYDLSCLVQTVAQKVLWS